MPYQKPYGKNHFALFIYSMSKAKKIKTDKTKRAYELAGGAAVSQVSIRRIKRELDNTANLLQARARDYD